MSGAAGESGATSFVDAEFVSEFKCMITSGVNAFSAHVVISDEAFASRSYHDTLDELHACLGEHFDTDHCTLQLESASHAEHEHSTRLHP